MLKNIIILIGLLATVALGYYIFVLENQSVLTANATVASSAEQQAREFRQSLNDLEQISIQTDVLSDPRFTNRVDYSRPVPVLPAGRENPFIPAD